MSVEIRTVQPAEGAEVASVLQALIARELAFPAEALRHFQKQWTAVGIDEASRGGRHVLRVAWQEERIVGVLVGMPPEGGVGTIIWALVDGEHQRRGIGARLMAESFAAYRGIGAHKVKLTAPNRAAVSFYERAGMRVEGHHPNHWWRMEFWSLAKEL